jgi:hypothetical protein
MSPSLNRHELFKWHYILLIYERMGYSAVNLGSYEIQLSASQISTVAQKISIPFVSCNVVDAHQKSPLVTPYKIKVVKGVKVAITGLVESSAQIGEGIALLDPTEALERYLSEMVSQSHLLIVLGNLSQKTLARIVGRFPQIHIIFNTGETGTFTPKKIGALIVSSLSSQGRFLQILQTFPGKSGEPGWASGQNVRLGDDIPDHAGTAFLLSRYHEELAAKQFYLSELYEHRKDYAGSLACSRCHGEIYKQWRKTAHTHSLESLKKKHNQHDPNCLRCHTTGFGFRGGYLGEEKTPELSFVGCEACHGPSAKHAYHQNEAKLRPSPTHPNPKQVCLECHTWEHCDNFDFKTFWTKIAHGQGKNR